MVTWRVEQVAAMGWVDVEKYSGNHDGLFFEQFFEESLRSRFNMQFHGRIQMNAHQAIIQRRWKFLDVEPYVESARGRNIDIEIKFAESLKDIVPFCLEMSLEGNL